MAKMKILAVDDEPNILLSLEFILEQEGYDVHVARDGEEALALAEKIHPDLILLDVGMPRKDGYEVCRIMRQHEGLAATKVVMLTAKGREAEKKKGLELGADAYIPKPFSTHELVETVRSLLGSGLPFCDGSPLFEVDQQGHCRHRSFQLVLFQQFLDCCGYGG